MSTALSPDHQQRSSLRSGRLIALLSICLYVAWDLFFPRLTDLRNFDPVEVARIEMKMWRAYNQGDKLPMFFDLAQLLRSEFHLPFLRSNLTALYAIRAAFIFKRGRSRAEFEQALPDLRRYFSVLREISKTPFDVEKTARLELDWWIFHRDRAPQFEAGIAAAEAELFRVSPARLVEHAHYRAEAIRVRDAGGDWGLIAKLLRQSWSSLARVLQS